MTFIEDIDKGLRKMATSLEQEDTAYIRADCPKCRAKDIRIHKMRARYGHVKCPECGEQLVVMMERD